MQLTGTRHCEQPGDGHLALLAAGAEHDLPPLDRGSERPLGRIVGRRDTFLVHEGEEMLVVHEERQGQVADVRVGRIEMPLPEGKQPFPR